MLSWIFGNLFEGEKAMIKEIKSSLVMPEAELVQSGSPSSERISSFSLLVDDAVAAARSTLSSQENNTKDAQDSGSITKNSFTGFFEEIQEKRMEELREEILEEMGLTEEMLEKMDPEARGRIENIIAKEIQKRIMVQSAMDGDEEEQPPVKRMLLESIDSLTL